MGAVDGRGRDVDQAPERTSGDAEGEGYHVIGLEALIRMKLTSFRLKDQTHLDDMLRVGLIDASLKERLPAELAERFQTILDQFEPELFG